MTTKCSALRLDTGNRFPSREKKALHCLSGRRLSLARNKSRAFAVNGGVKILSGGGLKILWERPTHGWLKGLRSHWRRFELIFHSEAAAFDHDGFSVVKEAVQNGRGDGAVVVENRGPLFKGFVGGQDDGAAFISLADSLEEQIGAVLVDG